MFDLIKDGWQLFIALIFVYIGAYIAFGSLKELILGRRSDDWPSVKGTIVKSQVEKDKKKKKSKSWGGRIFKKRKKKSSNSEKRGTYIPQVDYEYSVNDQAYQNDRVAYMEADAVDWDSAEEIVSRYREESTVRVYYSPNKPQRSVLEPGLTFWRGLGGVLLFLLGLVILGVASYVIYQGVMERFF